MQKFKVVPLDLFRIQASENVRLLEFHAQRKLGRLAYDFTLHEDGFVHPIKNEMTYNGPNGMGLRPMSLDLVEIVSSFRGKWAFKIPSGTFLPDDLILYLKQYDIYSLQTSNICTPKILNAKLNLFLQENSERMTFKDFKDRYVKPYMMASKF